MQMHERLLEELLIKVPHVNHKVGQDWIKNVIIETSIDLEKTGEQFSKDAFDHEVEKTVKWHIKRLNGIGGSDMSVLYTEYLGGFYPMEGVDAASIVSQKLCLTTPGTKNGDMERGIETEKVARRKFIMKMNKTHKLRHYHEAYDALDKMNESGGVPDYEWMRSSPDGIYIDEETGKVWLVDFKSPAQHEAAVEMFETPPDYYKVQIAQYKYNLEAAGIKVDHVALVPFSTKTWDVEIGEFKIEDKMVRDMLAAGDNYWSLVLKNELPKRPMSENFSYVGEMPKEMQQIMADFIMTKKMMSILKANDDKNKSRLLKMASLCGVDWNQPDQKTRLPGVDISLKSKVTVDHKAIGEAYNTLVLGAANKIRDLDINDPDYFNKVQEIRATIEEFNPKSEEFKKISESTTVSVIRGKKTPHSPWINELETIGDRAINFAKEDMLDENGFKLKEGDLSKLVQDPTSPLFGFEGEELEEATKLFNDMGYFVDSEENTDETEELSI